MSTTSLNFYGATEVTVRVECVNSSKWLSLDFTARDGSRLEVTLFSDSPEQLLQAIARAANTTTEGFVCEPCKGTGTGGSFVGGENDGGQSASWVADACQHCDGSGIARAAAPAHDELVAALEGLMALESRGRIMPIGREWDAARAALTKAAGSALDDAQTTGSEANG